MDKFKSYITKNNVIVALLVIIFLVILFNGCGNDKPLEITKTTTYTITQRLKQDEKVSAKIIDSLKKNEAKLEVEIKKTSKDLKAANKLANDLLGDIITIIDSSGNTELKEKIKEYTAADAIEDSLYETVIATQAIMLSNKDAQIKEHLDFNSKLRTSFNNVVENDQLKDRNIKTLKKQLRNKKAGTVVWKVVAGVLVAIIVKDKL